MMKLDFLLFFILLVSTGVLATYSIKTKSKKYFVYMRISFFYAYSFCHSNV